MISLTSVSKTFVRGDSEITALQTIALVVGVNELIGIQGPSGAGKTTLLTILGLLDRPSRGTVSFRGKDPWSVPDRSRARVRASEIGFVFQTYNLLHGLTAWRNVELPLKLAKKFTRQQRRRLVDSALDRVGLTNRANHYPSQVSGGEAQRIAIARATVANPHLLLADEPTGNLDSDTGDHVLDLICSFRSPDSSVVIVTHNGHIADRCQRLIHLSDGRILDAAP
jgi:putative ABC transport system ATP-binding protein